MRPLEASDGQDGVRRGARGAISLTLRLDRSAALGNVGACIRRDGAVRWCGEVALRIAGQQRRLAEVAAKQIRCALQARKPPQTRL